MEPTETLVPVAMYDSDKDAQQAATALVAGGIGAVVQHIGIDFEADEDTPATVSSRVAVLPADRRRASELLGFADPADAVVAKPTMPVGRVLLIFAVAMVVIPGLAFWLSYNFS